jgi:pyruvate kinase
MIADRRTKIVATIGPATASDEAIRKLILSGMNVARLNFSHGDYAQYESIIQSLRYWSEELRAPVAILQDLQGPKIRVGKLKNGQMILTPGQTVRITIEDVLGEGDLIPSDFKELISSVYPGDTILLDDGLLSLEVTEILQTHLHAKVVYGGLLKDRKGMNIPGRTLKVDCLTDKDKRDLTFGLEKGLDIVALSFVRFGKDLKQLRSYVDKINPQVKICAKIEMREAIDHLDEIVRLSDLVMVARGDLAVEVGQSKLPFYQKQIIKTANHYNKPVITATQMLDSMVSNPRPTRAEITDVANAVLDGTDALMLSAETASGQYPFKCIETMDEIIREVESTSDSLYHKLSLELEFLTDPSAIAASAAYTALKLNAKMIVCLSTSGKTAGIISGFRPRARLVAITDRFDVLNRMEHVWGLQTLLVPTYQSVKQVKSEIEQILIEYGLVKPGDRLVMTLGLPIDEGAKTNTLHTWTISDQGYSPLSENQSLPLRFQKVRHKTS